MIRSVLASLLAVGVLAGCATVPPRVLATRTPAMPVVAVTAQVDEPVAFPLTQIADGSSSASPTESATPSAPTDTPTPPAPEPSAPASPEPTTEPVDCSKAKCVALTLDDGPVPQTAKVLDLLKKLDVKATFFVLGEMAKAHPKIVQRIVREGHAVGNHSWSHPEFWKCSKASIRKQLTKTNRLLTHLGATPTLMRPPFGEWDARVAKISRKLGLAGILWDVDPLDWKSRNTKKVVKSVLRKVKPGSIILTHDTLKTTRKAYPAIIKKLRAKGYVFVTVPELLAGELHAGGRYSNA